ncbi:DUF6966 domain-containing protein [Bacteroides fragilis]|jgi:hypothetical protein|uniref:DUF6966 domain-containing protein n=1 Tax=Bacteroides fragilis TaxID=817 RepID=UPI00388E235F|nr:hypothetical protein SGJ39_10295 [Bacteroides fragilis]
MKEDCMQILFILNSVGESTWSVYLSNLLNQDLDNVSLARKILQMYKGGMNSFNDLVLSNGSNFYPQENDKLEVLKRSLYNKAITYL